MHTPAIKNFLSYNPFPVVSPPFSRCRSDSPRLELAPAHVALLDEVQAPVRGHAELVPGQGVASLVERVLHLVLDIAPHEGV